MTLEDFAAAVHKDYLAISKQMATKEDLKQFATKEDIRAIRAEMATKADIMKIREEMATKEGLADVSDRISVAKDELQEQISGLRYAKEIDALAARVKLVEEKVGIGPRRRAA